MANTPTSPISRHTVDRLMGEMGIQDLSQATIREVSQLAKRVEAESGTHLLHMEMGVPGLHPSSIGIEAGINSLRCGCAQCYPPVDGFPEVREALQRFVRAFLNVDVKAEGCLPTVGSMQAGMAAFLLVNRCQPSHDRVLFIDPGFPVQKQQLRLMGMQYDTFDLYDFRGAALEGRLRSFLDRGHTSAILYSNPNNPSWVCLTEEELEIIGRLATEYGVIVIEDLAYLGMDFRQDLSRPGQPPFQPSVARYTDRWLMLLSASKIFSYAGERIGAIIVSNRLFETDYPLLADYFPAARFGRALIYGALYGLSSGVSSTAQRSFAALLNAATDGQYDFVDHVREYGERAKRLKGIFTKHGFSIVYDHDGPAPLADGFYFTLRYPGLSGGELLRELLCYGVSAIALSAMGSEQGDGLRACVSHIEEEQYDILDSWMAAFNRDHSV